MQVATAQAETARLDQELQAELQALPSSKIPTLVSKLQKMGISSNSKLGQTQLADLVRQAKAGKHAADTADLVVRTRQQLTADLAR